MNVELLRKYIEGNATDEESRRVTQWIQESPDNMREYMAQRKLFDVALWRTEPVMEARQPAKGHSRMRRLCVEVAKVAAVLAVAWVGLQLWPREPQPAEQVAMQTIYVPAGQRVELSLADGTRVWLNARTTLSFPGKFTGDTRCVKLDGEGYFDVAKNAGQPFVVETGKCDVKVLGTEFNVMAYREDSVWETSLLRGAVEIVIPGQRQTLRLEPNTMASLKGNRLTKGTIKETDHFLWREGLICFNNISVGDMMEKLKLYYGVDIVVNNRRIVNNRYTGKFRTKDGVEHVLKVLRLNNRFTYTKDDETNVITIN